MEEIYLDNSATTRVCEKSAEKVLELMTQCYGNPSSLHKKGLEAQREVAHARQAVAVSLGAQPREIIFTSGGTEANNLAVLGGAAAGRRRGKRIVTTAIEHPSVLECAVTGLPDPIRGNVVKATIVLKPGFEGSEELKKELQTYVKKETAPYKYPRVIEFVDSLPKTVNGKIRRTEIRANDLRKLK